MENTNNNTPYCNTPADLHYWQPLGGYSGPDGKWVERLECAKCRRVRVDVTVGASERCLADGTAGATYSFFVAAKVSA
jgi:hypothetical protein